MENFLSKERAGALNSIFGTEGYQAILDVIEHFVVETENDLIGTHPKDQALVVASHNIAYAQRALFQKVQEKINQIVNELRGIKPATAEEKTKALLNDLVNVLPGLEAQQ